MIWTRFQEYVLSLHRGMLYLKHLTLTCAFNGSEGLKLTELNTSSKCLHGVHPVVCDLMCICLECINIIQMLIICDYVYY
jgi:hypothetical protein